VGPAKTLQVCERIHRIGQMKDVTIYKLYINNTIEKKIQKLLVQKDKMSHLCLNRWIIEDITYYNADWIDEHIELIDKIPENEEM
jgi:SNF2 family DNA or RNA helicase